MKKITLFILAAVAMVFAGCQDYDSDIDNINARLSNLENWQTAINNNISSLQTIVTALQNKDYVTGVVTLNDGTGYQITFKNSGTITIKNGTNGTNGTNGKDGTNGTNGKDAITPIIGVKLYTDGFYYWTIDTGDGKGAQWLKDSSGNMIRTTGDKGDTGDTGATGETGASGEDAVSPPQVRINTDKESDNYNMWEISTDEGTTWTSTSVKATGDKGTTGNTGLGDIIFAKDGVNVGSNMVTFTLADGTVLTIPLYQLMAIAPEIANDVIYILEETAELSLKLPAGLKYDDIAYIRAEAKNTFGSGIDLQTRSEATVNLWGTQLTMPSSKNDGTCNDNAKIKVTIPNIISFDDYKVLLLVTLTKTDGSEVTASRTIQCPDKFNYSGSGTSTSPYLIYNSVQLADIANDTLNTSYFKQVKDIDMRGVCGDGNNESVNRTWIPIGNDSIPFKGHFDGNSKAITNLYISKNSPSQGLFGVNAGTILNIRLNGYVYSSVSYAGSIVGYNKGVISGCCYGGKVIAFTYAGGIAGYNYNGTIDGCYNTGSITTIGSVPSVFNSYSYTGGIVAESCGGSISNCYNTGNVTSDQAYSGGICGSSYFSTIIHCYNTGKILGSGYVGGIAGTQKGCIIACYNLGNIRNYASGTLNTNKRNSDVGGISGATSCAITPNVLSYIVGCYCRALVWGTYFVAGISPDVDTFEGHTTGNGGIIASYFEGTVRGNVVEDSPSHLVNACGIAYFANSSMNISATNYYEGDCKSNQYGTKVTVDGLKSATIIGNMNADIATWNTNHPTLICYYHYVADTSNFNGGYPILVTGKP